MTRIGLRKPAAIADVGNHDDSKAVQLDLTSFGFWIYLMTDLVLFATLFAAYGVLRKATFNGPPLGELFSLPFVLIETLLLLVSSFTSGLMVLAAKQGSRQLVLLGLAATFALGLGFLGMELYEFGRLVAEGYSWRSSGAMSAFFTLVGVHGAHIAVGMLWMAVMAWRIWKAGKTIGSNDLRRLTLFSLFWHFLDIVWIFIFTFVYLIGAAS